METQQITSKEIMIKYGIILGVFTILLNVILYITDNFLTPHWSLGVLSFLILVVAVYLGFKTFKEGNGGFFKLSQALKIGLGISLIGGIIGMLWTILLTQVLEPEYSTLFLDAARDQMIEQNPDMGDAQMDQIIEFQKNFTKIGFMIPVGIIMSIFFGFIVSLIAGLIMKKENPYADA